MIWNIIWLLISLYDSNNIQLSDYLCRSVSDSSTSQTVCHFCTEVHELSVSGFHLFTSWQGGALRSNSYSYFFYFFDYFFPSLCSIQLPFSACVIHLERMSVWVTKRPRHSSAGVIHLQNIFCMPQDDHCVCSTHHYCCVDRDLTEHRGTRSKPVHQELAGLVLISMPWVGSRHPHC